MKFNFLQAAETPMDLLLLADPEASIIQEYLPQSKIMAAMEEGQILGVIVFLEISESKLELMNIAVYPSHQKKGIGGQLLKESIQWAIMHQFSSIELGTGTFGYQLAFYQKAGFRVDRIIKDHFLNSYSSPIFETGLQHKDMLRLKLDLEAFTDH
ncbi:GNAT family N-acetyltransferase [Persicobacter diffluens]|uniref:N-acetyltransferase n=1 Tax=Persicobacter diffluens TaxID=981 RepID=A0AAN4VXL0_9BACT|nr:N-acetyltransferase [Persicobacter diffluens]